MKTVFINCSPKKRFCASAYFLFLQRLFVRGTKVSEKLQQMVYAEGTTVIPLIASYVYHNGDWKNREYKNWQKIYNK